MSHPDIPKIEELGAELAFWNTYRELRRAKGFDPDLVLKECAAAQEKLFPESSRRVATSTACPFEPSHIGAAGSQAARAFWTTLAGTSASAVRRPLSAKPEINPGVDGILLDSSSPRTNRV